MPACGVDDAWSVPIELAKKADSEGNKAGRLAVELVTDGTSATSLE